MRVRELRGHQHTQPVPEQAQARIDILALLRLCLQIMGWADSTMVLMAKRYGHVSQSAKQEALAVLDRPHPSEQDTTASQQAAEPSTTVN